MDIIRGRICDVDRDPTAIMRILTMRTFAAITLSITLLAPAAPAGPSQAAVGPHPEDAGGRPPVLRATGESDAYIQLLRNAIAWGMV